MKRNLWIICLLGLLLAACTASGGSQVTSGSLTIQNAWARPTIMNDMGDQSGDAMGGNSGAAYMTIINKGSAADRLLRIESDAAKTVEIHQTTIQDNVASMAPVDAIEVPANGQVELKPGGYHIMLMDLKQELKIGGKVKLALVFEKVGTVNVEAEVKNP